MSGNLRIKVSYFYFIKWKKNCWWLLLINPETQQNIYILIDSLLMRWWNTGKNPGEILDWKQTIIAIFWSVFFFGGGGVGWMGSLA